MVHGPTQKEEKMKRETVKIFRILNILERCKNEGKWDLALHMIKKYCIDPEKLEEDYYD